MTEMLVAVAILGLAAGMGKLGFDWLNALARQRVIMEGQWQAQVLLYDITRSVRNSDTIVSVSPGTLQLWVYRPGMTGGAAFTGENIFSEVNRATITYQFVNDGKERFLRRTMSSQWGNHSQKFLINSIMEPDVTDWMFHRYPIGDTDPDIKAVQVRLRLLPQFLKSSTPIVFEAISMRRARGEDE